MNIKGVSTLCNEYMPGSKKGTDPLNPGWVATIRVPVAVARNTRSAVCIRRKGDGGIKPSLLSRRVLKQVFA